MQNDDINEEAEDIVGDEFAALFAAAGGGSANTQWERQLTPTQVEVLDLFEDWCQTDDGGLKESTAGAYRGMVAQALVRIGKGEEWKNLSTDIRSAVNKFKQFKEFTDVSDEAAADA